MSIQVAILKVLASHGNGRATLASLKRDIVILSASGPDWDARIKRLARRVPAIDIFGSGYVLRDDEGWQITPAGRDCLSALEAVSQDNQPTEVDLPPSQQKRREGALIDRHLQSTSEGRSGDGTARCGPRCRARARCPSRTGGCSR